MIHFSVNLLKRRLTPIPLPGGEFSFLRRNECVHLGDMFQSLPIGAGAEENLSPSAESFDPRGDDDPFTLQTKARCYCLLVVSLICC